MAKAIPDTILDLMLDQAEGNTIHITSAQPANYAGIAAVVLAQGSAGAYTAANGDVSGRKNTMAAVTGLPITNTGTATHVVISDGASTLKLITTCTSQALTSGGTVDTSTWSHEITDPS